MSGTFYPQVVDENRPVGMTVFETVIWEALAAATQAAFARFVSHGADLLSMDALAALAQLDAGQAAQPHINRFAETYYMRASLGRAISAEGVAAARILVADMVAPSASGPAAPSWDDVAQGRPS